MLLFLRGRGSSGIRMSYVIAGSYWFAGKGSWMNSREFFLSFKCLCVGLIPGEPSSLTGFHTPLYTFQNMHCSPWVFVQLYRAAAAAGTQRNAHSESAQVPRRESHGAFWTPNLTEKEHHSSVTKHPGTRSWSNFSWGQRGRGRARAEAGGDNGGCIKATERSKSKALSTGTPFPELSQSWLYGQTSFYCTLTDCISQILCFIQTEDLWQPCTVRWQHFLAIKYF